MLGDTYIIHPEDRQLMSLLLLLRQMVTAPIVDAEGTPSKTSFRVVSYIKPNITIGYLVLYDKCPKGRFICIPQHDLRLIQNDNVRRDDVVIWLNRWENNWGGWNPLLSSYTV